MKKLQKVLAVATGRFVCQEKSHSDYEASVQKIRESFTQVETKETQQPKKYLVHMPKNLDKVITSQSQHVVMALQLAKQQGEEAYKQKQRETHGVSKPVLNLRGLVNLNNIMVDLGETITDYHNVTPDQLTKLEEIKQRTKKLYEQFKGADIIDAFSQVLSLLVIVEEIQIKLPENNQGKRVKIPILKGIVSPSLPPNTQRLMGIEQKRYFSGGGAELKLSIDPTRCHQQTSNDYFENCFAEAFKDILPPIPRLALNPGRPLKKVLRCFTQLVDSVPVGDLDAASLEDGQRILFEDENGRHIHAGVAEMEHNVGEVWVRSQLGNGSLMHMPLADLIKAYPNTKKLSVYE